MSFSLDTLEFDLLLDLVASFTQTPMGRERVLQMHPLTTRNALDTALAAVDEAIRLKEKQISWSFSGVENPSDVLAILKIENASLEPVLMLQVVHICRQALHARAIIKPQKETTPILWQTVEKIPSRLRTVIDSVTKKLQPGGEINDEASTELATLRRNIHAQRARLTTLLESLMRSAGSAIQEEIVTIRNDRFVIPVKVDFRRKVSGVAHGFSSSGQTVYIEPLEAIEANNELQNLRGKEEREVARILFELTEHLREQLPAIETCINAVAELDFIRAKVEFASKFAANVPEITDDELSLLDARHPLLEETLRTHSTQTRNDAESKLSVIREGASSEIVPFSFSLTSQNPVMIVSGANAGGKTVVLKTAGLLGLMAISGLPIPASSAKVPFYRSILADIGDHQSLGASLSTFSSHMSNIAGMVRNCKIPSLVLLDEVGTGTDPDEGSALGVAIVDHFRRQGAQVIASTHYRGLKNYAANNENVINASVEFDEQTLRPTYRLLLGLAGTSSGLEIARRFGINDNIIENACKNLEASDREAEVYLQKLKIETLQAEDLRIALEEEREAVAQKYADLEIEAQRKDNARQKEFERQLEQAMDEFDRQSKAFLQTLKDKALKARLEKMHQSSKYKLKRSVAPKASRQLSVVTAQNEKFASRPDVLGQSGIIVVGSRVVTSFGKIGTVGKLDNDTAEILVGSIHLREKIADLHLVESESQPSATESKRSRVRGSIEDRHADAELNLIGQTTADAEYELDRFIDQAYMARLPRVRIVHGHGTGTLRNFVHHFLKDHPHIEKYAFAPSSQGGNGATIAELKQ